MSFSSSTAIKLSHPRLGNFSAGANLTTPRLFKPNCLCVSRISGFGSSNHAFNAASSLNHRSATSRNGPVPRLRCAGPEGPADTAEEGSEALKIVSEPLLDGCDGGGGDGGDGFGGDGGGGEGGDGGEADDGDEKEFGPIMKFEDVMKEMEAYGATLPPDMLEAAQTTGIRRLILERYLELQGSIWLGFLMRYCAMLRNRMLADPSFLFKVGTEVVIDSCCATFAEVQKRGEDFWAEFELYAADLLVGIVVDIALVGMLAPYTRFGKPSVSGGGLFGRMQHACASLPSSVFEAERPGCRFSARQRIATYFYKGILYGSVGFGCGLVGQGIANFIMTAKRNMNKSENDVAVPPLIKSAALWGFFLAVSSNTRYQIINGLEQLVERSPVAKRAPPVAMAFTIGVRFANNIYGGMQFVDWARLSGVQ